MSEVKDAISATTGNSTADGKACTALNRLIKKAHDTLATKIEFSIAHNASASELEGYTLEIHRAKVVSPALSFNTRKSAEVIVNKFQKRLELLDESRRAVQGKQDEIRKKLEGEVNEAAYALHKALQVASDAEDERLLKIIGKLERLLTSKRVSEKDLKQWVKAGEAKTRFAQQYKIEEVLGTKTINEMHRMKTFVDIKDIEGTAPQITNVFVDGKVFVSFSFFNEFVKHIIREKMREDVVLKAVVREDRTEDSAAVYTLDPDDYSFVLRSPKTETRYHIKMRVECNGKSSVWSKATGFITLGFCRCLLWKENENNPETKRFYRLDETNPRIVVNMGACTCGAFGNAALQLNRIVKWGIKVLKSKKDCELLFVGVAYADVNYSVNYDCWNYGWFYDCHTSSLLVKQPFMEEEPYGDKKVMGYGSVVQVVMDTAKGELFFLADSDHAPVAFTDVPLDKPLVPCVILGNPGDSVELVYQDEQEREVGLGEIVSVPADLDASNWKCDSVELSWADTGGYASFFQVETNGVVQDILRRVDTCIFLKKGLLSNTEYSFRVRAVYGDRVSEWSKRVKGTTSELSLCYRWKEFPASYSLNKMNPCVATKINSNSNGWCTIIGNRYFPFNEVTSWNIKILRSLKNDGEGIYIGVAPPNINQNENCNYNKCGWYFGCYYSTLYSGPPHSYSGKGYGPRKEDGQYVHTGDSVGVVMDTAKGELSFVLSGVNLSVAFEGIPLDKPLVPCVILCYQDDSVELIV